jgi:hypothetical protein
VLDVMHTGISEIELKLHSFAQPSQAMFHINKEV